MNVPLTHILKIGDAERIEHTGEQHVLSDEGQLTVPLNLGQCMGKVAVHLHERDDLKQGICEHDADATEGWNEQEPVLAF